MLNWASVSVDITKVVLFSLNVKFVINYLPVQESPVLQYHVDRSMTTS